LVVSGGDGHTQSLMTTGNGLKLTALTATGNLDHEIAAKGDGTVGTAYLYVVVAVADLDADADYELGKEKVNEVETTYNTLEFTLQRTPRPAPTTGD